ncbi:MAG: hypothetical protein LBN26_01040 [Christensenellaceae bacterium]|jgi:hypothetical protein|nr:hypothetical protein [Christensenellaceae bacterium]
MWKNKRNIIGALIIAIALVGVIQGMVRGIRMAQVYDTIDEAISNGIYRDENEEYEVIKKLDYGDRVVVITYNIERLRTCYVYIVERREGKYRMPSIAMKLVSIDLTQSLEGWTLYKNRIIIMSSKAFYCNGNQFASDVTYNPLIKTMTIGGQSPDEIIELQDADGGTIYLWYYYDLKDPKGEINLPEEVVTAVR